MGYTNQTLWDMINDTLEQGQQLSDWERNFLESVGDQLHKKDYLTENQQETLERIYKRKVYR